MRAFCRQVVFDDPDDFKPALSVMAEGPYRLMQLITSDMVSNDYGRIVNVFWLGRFSDGLEMAGHYGGQGGLECLDQGVGEISACFGEGQPACPGW